MLRKILLIQLLIFGISNAQTQIGNDINGEAAGDMSGLVSISADGNTLAIGAMQNDGNGENSGCVRVFKNISGSWTQFGSNINGEAAGNQFGSRVSISADGNTLAIGQDNNGGNGQNLDYVRVFKNISGSWTQIGNVINGEAAGDWANNVSISADGNTLAIGAHRNNGNGIDSGHVRVFKNISGAWTQIGSDIDGEAAGDQFGQVSISDDGNTLAVGAWLNDGNGQNSGHVRVFKNIAGSWTQIGNDINGEASGDYFGSALSISADGNTLAIGAPRNDGNGIDSGHVRVFKNISGSWSQIGSDIDGEAAGDEFGMVSISADGNIIACFAKWNDGIAINSGHIRIFKNINSVWSQIGNDIDGVAPFDLLGNSLSISADGSILAAGSFYMNNEAGLVRVFNLSAILASNSYVESNFNIFPNPSKGVVNFSLDNNLQIEKVNVYNQLGQLVKTTKSNIISTLELEKGCYFIQVVTSQGNATKQLIVE